MEGKTLYFDRPGPENTEAVIGHSLQRAEELGLKHIVVATGG